MRNKPVILIAFVFLLGCYTESEKQKKYYETGELMIEEFTQNDTLFYQEYNKNGNLSKQRQSFNKFNLVRKFNDEAPQQLMYKFARMNDTITYAVKYDEAGYKIDSLVKSKLNINITSDVDTYSVGDTANIKIKMIDRNYDDQSINLVEDFNVNSLFSFENYRSRDHEIDLEFLCDSKGENILRIIYYDTSFEMVEQLGDSAFYGYRYGLFDFIEYSYIVE
ncbi:hypothetical protein SAMN05661096_00422 [Marivirga sericea]|uniref:Lipoprotein n=1 Tax=Marivirga sericea TaxID=1028 RepID=A0A1X7IBV0_9BACT|nr:hypothetical protein [Marivirga sericea]SMG11679.1 hypothetical protein SAMN05661096_00422 [Marivirga sericea]